MPVKLFFQYGNDNQVLPEFGKELRGVSFNLSLVEIEAVEVVVTLVYPGSRIIHPGRSPGFQRQRINLNRVLPAEGIAIDEQE